jgi:hypothetical protein
MFLHTADEDRSVPYTWPGCSSVFGGPSLLSAFVHKDSLWRRVLNSWFQIQDSRSKSSLSSTCKVPKHQTMCQDYMALEWNVPLSLTTKITQVIARRIYWMDPGMRHISRRLCLLATRKQGVKLTRFAESYSRYGEVAEKFGDVASLDGLIHESHRGAKAKTKLAISKGGWGGGKDT